MIAYRDSLAYWINELELDVDPNTFEFGFDMETHVTPENHETIKMLAFLASNATIWNTWKVPGSLGWAPSASHATNTTGETLAELYAKMVIVTSASDDPWPEDIFDETDGIKPDLNHEDDNNRRYFLWFVSICERAREAVMFTSAYDVLRDPTHGWPDATCSNYNAANYDDLTDPTPTPRPTSTWFADKSKWPTVPDPNDPDSWNPAETEPHYTRAMPGAYLSPSQSRYLYEPASRSDRWIGYRRKSLGQVDAPELYQLSPVQWAGNHVLDIHGHWSLNPYVPPNEQYDGTQSPGAAYPGAIADPTWGNWTYLKETKAQTRLVIQRHAVESIINAGNGGNEARLGPWVSAFIKSGGNQSVYRSAERENRMVLAMLRAKGVPRIKFWFTHEEESWDADEQFHAFVDTRDLVNRVWATDVVSIVTLLGDAHEPEGGGTLDDTLRDENGADVMFGLESTDTPPGIVAMEVVIRVPLDDRLFSLNHHFEINLEAVAPSGVIGSLFARDRLLDQWVRVRTMDDAEKYGSDTTVEWDTMDPAELRAIRRTFWLRARRTARTTGSCSRQTRRTTTRTCSCGSITITRGPGAPRRGSTCSRPCP
ncbi:MAG: hypothetical protein HBSAPP03_19580 [Phycisphaerae bacterium]|nr:MAG: hypothetical protein HBSAPP03_19580 [Phycisphaerae bacterium]